MSEKEFYAETPAAAAAEAYAFSQCRVGTSRLTRAGPMHLITRAEADACVQRAGRMRIVAAAELAGAVLCAVAIFLLLP